MSGLKECIETVRKAKAFDKIESMLTKQGNVSDLSTTYYFCLRVPNHQLDETLMEIIESL